MNKSILFFRMASSRVGDFKKTVELIGVSAKFYTALTSDIKCGEEVVAVEVYDGYSETAEFFEMFASYGLYRICWLIPQEHTKTANHRIAVFRIKFNSGYPEDNLLEVWRYCDEAAKKLSFEDKQLLNFVLYADGENNRICFQADCRDEAGLSRWQEMIGRFCGHVMKLHFADVKVRIEQCLIKTNF